KVPTVRGLPCTGHSPWQLSTRKAPLLGSGLAFGSRAERTPEIRPANIEDDLNLRHLGAHRSRTNDLRFHRVLPAAVHQEQLLPAAHADAEDEQSAFLCGVDGLPLFVERVLIRAVAVNVYGRIGRPGVRSTLAGTHS